METPPNWPSPEPGQVQVMLLGTYHMDNPGLDANNVNADDVLAPSRQTELRELVGRLAEWNPDGVAVERPHEQEAEVNEIYRAYRDDEYAYDEAVQFGSPAGGRDDPTSECRSEVVQVGFRLADRLGHGTVDAVDSRPEMEVGEPIPDWSIETDPQDVPYPAPDAEVVAMKQQSRLAENTLVEYHRFKNTEEQLLPPDRAMYQYALDDWDTEEYAGVAALSL